MQIKIPSLPVHDHVGGAGAGASAGGRRHILVCCFSRVYGFRDKSSAVCTVRDIVNRTNTHADIHICSLCVFARVYVCRVVWF